MADRLEPLLPVEHLFDHQGEPLDAKGPAVWLPHHQGDVFSDVPMPGIVDAEPNFAMLFMHPCTMRSGVALKPKVTVIKVSKHASQKRLLDQPGDWNNNFKAMPLPDMLGDNQGTYFGDFMSVSTIDAKELDRTKRVARLSLAGRAQFQQRIIFHLTRFAPSVDRLEEVTVAVEEELALQEEWVGAAVDRDRNAPIDAICDHESSFDEYLRQHATVSPMRSSDAILLETKSRRDLLDTRYLRRVVAEVRQHIDAPVQGG